MPDRQLSFTRLLAASPEKVWRAYTDPQLLPRWWGPQGFSCRTKEIDLREGGLWRFDMIAPDGTVYVNRHRFTRHIAPRRIDFLMDADDDATLPMQVEVTMTPEGRGTRLNQSILFPSTEAYTTALSFGADRLGQQTIDKLEAFLTTL